MRTPSAEDRRPEKVFDLALEIAIERGSITYEKKLLISNKNSKYEGNSFLLKDYDDKTVCKINNAILFQRLQQTNQLKNPNEQKAVAWAKSLGYPVPKAPDGCMSVLLVIIGLCVFIVPGLIILLIVWNRSRQYELDMKALVEKWVDAGKPEPGVKARPVEQLEKVEEIPATSPSTESRLEELQSMKEKGLISQEEYDTLREKALGL